MKTYFKILCFIVFLSSLIYSQTIKCTYCKGNISGEYITVDGKPFHKNHFKCAHCGKQISGEYAFKNNRYYDKKCYTKLFALKCSVCGEPIDGEYLIDSYGYKYHKYHEKEFPRCDNCNRLISPNTTGGSVVYNDGRRICNICFKKKIETTGAYRKSFDRVIERLSNYNLHFNKSAVDLKIVNLDELQSISGNKHSENIQGYTKTKVNVKGNKKTYQHTIFLLKGIPPAYAESTIAHELMHIWLSENIEHKLSKQLEEGSCNYVSYTYLKSDFSSEADDIITALKRNPDKIYGEGFRKVYNRFKGRDFKNFLNYLKEKESI